MGPEAVGGAVDYATHGADSPSLVQLAVVDERAWVLERFAADLTAVVLANHCKSGDVHVNRYRAAFDKRRMTELN